MLELNGRRTVFRAYPKQVQFVSLIFGLGVEDIGWIMGSREVETEHLKRSQLDRRLWENLWLSISEISDS